MIKHRKETEEGDTSPLFDYSYSHRLEKSNYFILGLTGMYLLVSLFAIHHHEMWRDEMQAWLAEKGVSWEPVPKGAHEQAGLAETIVGAGKALLHATLRDVLKNGGVVDYGELAFAGTEAHNRGVG